jgi:hypothetical protein
MRTLLSLAALLLWSTDPSGHWEGVITAQFGTLHVEVDLTRNADGETTGTFAVPERKLKGIPFLTLKIDGRTLTFEPAGIGARFQGDFNDDGSSVSGTFEAAAGSVALTLTRNGDARVAPPPTSAPISAELEGTWNGAIEAGGRKRLVLKLANQADKRSSGTMTSLDEGGLELPVGIVQDGSKVRLDVPGVSSTYAGSLSADGKELVGSYTTSEEIELPLTFRKT